MTVWPGIKYVYKFYSRPDISIAYSYIPGQSDWPMMVDQADCTWLQGLCVVSCAIIDRHINRSTSKPYKYNSALRRTAKLTKSLENIAPTICITREIHVMKAVCENGSKLAKGALGRTD